MVDECQNDRVNFQVDDGSVLLYTSAQTLNNCLSAAQVFAKSILAVRLVVSGARYGSLRSHRQHGAWCDMPAYAAGRGSCSTEIGTAIQHVRSW